MKVTYLYQYFGTPSGSWSTRVYELTRRWVKKGVEVTVITAPYDKSDIKSKGFIHSTRIKGVKVIVINSGDSNQYPFLKRVYKALIFSLFSIYFTLKIKSDINIASSGPITIAIPALFAKFFKKTPFVFEVRDLWPDGAIELGLISNKLLKIIGLSFENFIYNLPIKLKRKNQDLFSGDIALPFNILVGLEGFITSDIGFGNPSYWGGVGIRIDYNFKPAS